MSAAASAAANAREPSYGLSEGGIFRAIAMVETRRLLVSPVAWAGAAASLVLTYQQMRIYLPMIRGDDGLAYRFSFVLQAAMMLAGAMSVLRDRDPGMRALVGLGRTGWLGINVARLAAAAIAGAALWIGYYVLALVISVIRGGRGTPFVILAVDGLLVTAFSAMLGVSLALLVRRRIAPCLIICAAYAVGLWWFGWQFGASATLAGWTGWLSPLSRMPTESVHLGFVPAVFTAHLPFVVGLTLALAGVAVLALSRRGGGTGAHRSVVIGGLVLIVVGVPVAAASAAPLVSTPGHMVATSPNPATWQAPQAGQHPETFVYPDDAGATVCREHDAFTACVYPAYAAVAQPVADSLGDVYRVVRGIPQAPHLIRMVPATDGSCDGDGEMLLREGRYVLNPDGVAFAASLRLMYSRCLFGSVADLAGMPAASAVTLWIELRAGHQSLPEVKSAIATYRADPRQCPPDETCDPMYFTVDLPGGMWQIDAAEAGVALDRLPPEQVRACLAQVWSKLPTMSTKELLTACSG